MSEPHVSSYDAKFVEAFGRGVSIIPEDQSKLLRALLDKIHESMISDLEYYIADQLKAQVDDTIRTEAANVARSMLMNALAGDSEEIRNLFGFNKYYMATAFNFDRLPTQWALIDALVERRPDLFVDERIAQRDREIEALKQERDRLRERIERLTSPECEIAPC